MPQWVDPTPCHWWLDQVWGSARERPFQVQPRPVRLRHTDVGAIAPTINPPTPINHQWVSGTAKRWRVHSLRTSCRAMPSRPRANAAPASGVALLLSCKPLAAVISHGPLNISSTTPPAPRALGNTAFQAEKPVLAPALPEGREVGVHLEVDGIQPKAVTQPATTGFDGPCQGQVFDHFTGQGPVSADGVVGLSAKQHERPGGKGHV